MARGRGRQPRQQPAPPRTAGHRPAPGNFREDSGSGEEFDFTPVDEHTPDGDVPDAPRPVSPISVEPVTSGYHFYDKTQRSEEHTSELQSPA